MTHPLDNYSGSLTVDAKDVRSPASLAELMTLIRQHDPAQGRLTLRASGNALHDQALSEGTVAYLHGLPHRVEVRPNDHVADAADGSKIEWHTAETTGWTPWEVLVRACLRLGEPAGWNRAKKGHWDVSAQGAPPPTEEDRNVCSWAAIAPAPRLLPYVLASSGRITVGGSLAGDTMWRFSSCFGKESRSVVWVDLLVFDRATDSFTTKRLFNAEAGFFDDRALHASPDVVFAGTRAENDELFDAVVGGFGLLGPVVRAKYLLLELDEQIDDDAFQLWSGAPAGAGGQKTLLSRSMLARPEAPDREAPPPGIDFDEVLRHLRESPGADPDPVSEEDLRELLAPPEARAKSIRSFATAAVPAPPYPHAPAHELGRTGDELEQRALTWMWHVDSADEMFETLLAHLAHQEARHAGARIALPAKVDAEVVACFGLFFPNAVDHFFGVIGNVAFGRRTGWPRWRFKMWDRTYARDNMGTVLWALPRLARTGEWLAYLSIFGPALLATEWGFPCQNPIPEFALFMEGHTAGMEKEDVKPKTLQQTWVIPVPQDPAGRQTAKDAFSHLLGEVRAKSQTPKGQPGAIRVQICDVKAIPRGHALLSSTPDERAIAVTLAVEDGAEYGQNGWGSPQAVFRELAADMWQRAGARVHLTKNLEVERHDLRDMYEQARTRFEAAKAQVDPGGIWGSHFFEVTLP